MSYPNTTLFISYSHQDEELTKPVVDLLRTKDGFVFYDRDSILAGEIWNEKILASIETCDKLVLFWCSHSAKSEFVQREYQHALKFNKGLIPVKLDDTEIPSELACYQYIDLRNLAQKLHKGTKLKLILRTVFLFFINHKEPILNIATSLIQELDRQAKLENDSVKSGPSATTTTDPSSFSNIEDEL